MTFPDQFSEFVREYRERNGLRDLPVTARFTGPRPAQYETIECPHCRFGTNSSGYICARCNGSARISRRIS